MVIAILNIVGLFFYLIMALATSWEGLGLLVLLVILSSILEVSIL